VPDQVKQSFVIFDIRALWRSGRSGHDALYLYPYGNSGRQRVKYVGCYSQRCIFLCYRRISGARSDF